MIVEPDEAWQIFNWMQYFSAESIETELKAAGIIVDHMAGDLTGTPLKPESDLIGVIAGVV